ncbi:phage tail protein [Xenorhabdus sp. TH1]|uniref:phage tail protein n=1 Tax=Xenorhabdus sp. TH1 TaxID=3130166 RepID=UPI0030D0A2B0
MSTQDKKSETQFLENDGLVVVPTPEYVKDAIEEHAQSRNHPDATLQDKGFVVLSNDAGSDSETMAATPKAVKAAYDLANTANQNANNATNLANVANENANLALPVGVPVPWPTESPPEGWLICNGDSFDKERYPKLALAYPSGVLPDLRGEFIRGWDNSGKIDPGRSLLSVQDFAFEDHALTLPTSMGYAGVENGSIKSDIYAVISDALGYVGEINSNAHWKDMQQPKIYLRADGKPVGNNKELVNSNIAAHSILRTYRASTGWNNPYYNSPKTANETRPRNIAFNYIVRAA